MATLTRSEPAPARGAARRGDVLLSGLLVAYAALAILRVGLIPSLLDRVMNYTADEGGLVEKVHPTLYGFAAVALVSLATQRVALTAWEVRALRAMLLFAGGVVALLAAAALAGRGGSAGYMVDTYLTSCCAAILFVFPPSWRRPVGLALLAYLAVSALVGLAEFALKARLLPYDAVELTFRPTGLSNHPLELGLFCAMAVGFVAASGWPPRVRHGLTVLFVLGAFAAGARFAALAGLASAVALAIWQVGLGRAPRRALELRLLAAVLVVLAVPALVGLLAAAGALDRFQSGIVDESAMARVSVYGVFDGLGWGDILFGTDLDALRRVALERYGLRFIESSVVIFVAQFGALGTALFAALLVNLVRVLLSGARAGLALGALTFFVVSASNNGLSIKTGGVFLVFALLIALRPEPAGTEPAL